MSIMDSPFGDAETFKGGIEAANAILADVLPQLDPSVRNIIEATRDGSSLGAALGVTKEQKQALLNLGCQLVRTGQLDQASDVLMRLVQLDPLQEGALYALGIVCQTRGELQKAAYMYLQFLALDATNPVGYLRLGECLLKAGEYPEARDAFEMAKELAAEGKGKPGHLAEAERMLSVPEIAAAKVTPKQ